MLRSLPSAIDDALDTLYEPNAVFSQFLGSATITFFRFSFLCFLFLSCLSLFFLYFFSFLFRFSLSCLFFPVYFHFFVFFFPIDLRLSCACVDRYYVQYIRGSLSWVASGIDGFSRRE